MIRVDVHPDKRHKYVITVRAEEQPQGDDILLSSTSQGYENAEDAANVVRRLFPPVPPVDLTVGGGTGPAAAAAPEPVELYITYIGGGIRTEVLR